MLTPHIIFFFFDSNDIPIPTTEVGLGFIARERLHWTVHERLSFVNEEND
jgi:hypothetical protein